MVICCCYYICSCCCCWFIVEWTNEYCWALLRCCCSLRCSVLGAIVIYLVVVVVLLFWWFSLMILLLCSYLLPLLLLLLTYLFLPSFVVRYLIRSALFCCWLGLRCSYSPWLVVLLLYVTVCLRFTSLYALVGDYGQSVCWFIVLLHLLFGTCLPAILLLPLRAFISGSLLDLRLCIVLIVVHDWRRLFLLLRLTWIYHFTFSGLFCYLVLLLLLLRRYVVKPFVALCCCYLIVGDVGDPVIALSRCCCTLVVIVLLLRSSHVLVLVGVEFRLLPLFAVLLLLYLITVVDALFVVWCWWIVRCSVWSRCCWLPHAIVTLCIHLLVVQRSFVTVAGLGTLPIALCMLLYHSFLRSACRCGDSVVALFSRPFLLWSVVVRSGYSDGVVRSTFLVVVVDICCCSSLLVVVVHVVVLLLLWRCIIYVVGDGLVQIVTLVTVVTFCCSCSCLFPIALCSIFVHSRCCCLLYRFILFAFLLRLPYVTLSLFAAFVICRCVAFVYVVVVCCTLLLFVWFVARSVVVCCCCYVIPRRSLLLLRVTLALLTLFVRCSLPVTFVIVVVVVVRTLWWCVVHVVLLCWSLVVTYVALFDPRCYVVVVVSLFVELTFVAVVHFAFLTSLLLLLIARCSHVVTLLRCSYDPLMERWQRCLLLLFVYALYRDLFHCCCCCCCDRCCCCCCCCCCCYVAVVVVIYVALFVDSLYVVYCCCVWSLLLLLLLLLFVCCLFHVVVGVTLPLFLWSLQRWLLFIVVVVPFMRCYSRCYSFVILLFDWFVDLLSTFSPFVTMLLLLLYMAFCYCCVRYCYCCSSSFVIVVVVVLFLICCCCCCSRYLVTVVVVVGIVVILFCCWVLLLLIVEVL